MRVLEYVLMFIIGVIMTFLLFQVADQVHPENIKLNNILEIVVLFSYGLLLCLLYFDSRKRL